MKKELKGLYDLCKEKGLTDAELLPYFITIESNLKTKSYGLVWEEQLEDIAADLKNKFQILVEREDLSIKEDPNGLTNCLIEGDNYESLTFLKNSGVKVDCIYIDPPYNTGNQDFVYNDKYIDSEDTWRHSSWLSFMNKRLKLAKDLLTEDGVIFISIDDNEQANLKLLCSSIFGENNVEQFIWKKAQDNEGVLKMTNRFRVEHEYILVCYKDKNSVKFSKILDYSNFKNEYGNIDNDPRGDWMSAELCKGELKSNPNGKNYYTLTTPSGLEVTRQWHYSLDDLQDLIDDNRVYFGKLGTSIPRLKKFVDEKREKVPTSILQGYGTAKSAQKELTSILQGKLFDYPKPKELIKFLFTLTNKNSNATFIDFFAGSGTTGQAVLELNKEDGGNRKFILCTNNEVSNPKELEYLKKLGKVSGVSKKELTDSYKEYQSKDDYEFFKDSEDYASLGICRSVTYERLNRVINGYTTPKGKEVVGIPSNLKYYKVKNLDTSVNQMEIEDVLIENIVPFVQFKHNVCQKETVAEDLISLTNDSESVFVYSNTLYLCDGFYESINSSVKTKTLYIYGGLFEFLDEDRLGNVKVLSLTNEFYKN